MGAKRRYTFTRGGETLEFESATAARRHFYMGGTKFPATHLNRTWNGWEITAEEYTGNRYAKKGE